MRPNQLLSVLSLFLLVPASITWAQTISSQKGLTTAEFNTSAGNIKVYLPDDIRPGDVISGTIKIEATGKNAKQIEKNLSELKTYSINISNEKFPVDPDKKIQFKAERDVGAGGIELMLMTTTGKTAGQLTFNSNIKPAPEQCIIPTHALTASPLSIPGPFDGNASNTTCTLDNKSVEILAESPRQCIISYPADGGGLHTLHVQESEKPGCSQQVSGVDMNVSAGKLDLMKGEKTFIDVIITGLQNLPDTAVLTLTNITTGIVSMMPSDKIRIPILPDSTSSGIFNKRFDIESLKTGSFIVNVDLDLPDQNETTDHPPTTTEQSQCKCHADCAVVKAETRKGEVLYTGKVTAECMGNCSVAKITYNWHIGESGKDIAEIDGLNYAPTVTIKIKKAGSYTVYLNGTVTCSNGSICEFHCNLEETAPPDFPITHDCTIDYEWCAATSIKVKAIGYFPRGPLLSNMRPGELIGLSVSGSDSDVLIQKCTCPAGTSLTAYPPVPDEVFYSWEVWEEIGNKPGKGKLLKSEGSSNIYQLPYCYEQYPVKDEVVVRLRNKTGKAEDEIVVVVFTIELSVEVNGYNDELSVGQDNVVPLRTILADITPRIGNKPYDIVCTETKACCTALLPGKWEKGSNIIASNINKEYIEDGFPDNLVLLSIVNAGDSDDLTIKCVDPVTGRTTEKKIEAIPDALNYVWTVKSGNGKFIYNKGSSVVLIQKYGVDNTVYVTCDITDSKKQFEDNPTITLQRKILPRQKPVAVVALGNIEDFIPPSWKHDELEDISHLAVSKYKKAGYEVKYYEKTNSPLIGSVFKDPKTQAFMMMGHGADGEMEFTNGTGFGFSAVPLYIVSKWNCHPLAPMHPTIRELALLGCETHNDKWLDNFFRLERYHAYRDKVWSSSVSSRIVTFVKNFVPTSPRIAPPE